MLFNIWFIIGLVISVYILYFKKKSDNQVGKETRKRVKEAFQNNALYYAINGPAYVFWTIAFAVVWPLLIYATYFFKEDKQ